MPPKKKTVGGRGLSLGDAIRTKKSGPEGVRHPFQEKTQRQPTTLLKNLKNPVREGRRQKNRIES